MLKKIVLAESNITIRFFLPERLLSRDIQREIVSFIEQTFASGIHYVFYEIVFKKFSNQLLDSQITDEGMLHVYLKYYFDNKWYFFTQYVTDIKSIKFNIDQEVIEYVLEQGKVVFEEEVIQGLLHFPKELVRRSFNNNASTLLCNGQNQRFHIDMFIVSPEELNNISYIINTTIDEYTFISAKELINDIRQKVSSVITNNSTLSDLGIRNALTCKLGDKFSFNGAVISAKEEKFTASDAILSFSQKHDEYSLTEIDQLANTLGTILNYYLKKILKYSIRINSNTFISRKKISFHIEQIDEAIEKYNTSDYFPITNINNFVVFPDWGYRWNNICLKATY
ncbi:MAG: hypothetical protein LIP01_15430 [Tannerellaceae bacterium]|nr:hypothetical protein [Tannerellaceae bacterium]